MAQRKRQNATNASGTNPHHLHLPFPHLWTIWLSRQAVGCCCEKWDTAILLTPSLFWRGFWKCPELRRSFVQKIPSHFANQVYCPFQSNSARPRGSCNAPEFNPKLSQQLTPSGLSSSLQVHFNCASNILAHVWYDIIFSCMILYSLDLSCMIFYSLVWRCHRKCRKCHWGCCSSPFWRRKRLKVSTLSSSCRFCMFFLHVSACIGKKTCALYDHKMTTIWSLYGHRTFPEGLWKACDLRDFQHLSTSFNTINSS